MKDWRAAVRTWEKQSFGYGEKSSEQPANRLIMRNSLVLPEPESEASVNAAAEQAKKMFKSIVTKSKMEAV
jgi:hypothetical protein